MTFPRTPSPIATQAVRFARYLRQQGLPISPAQTLDFVHSLAWIDVADRHTVRDASRTIFVRRQEEIAPFEAAFERFWTNAVLDPREKRSSLADLRHESLWTLDVVETADLAEPPEDALNRTLAYTAVERLRQRDFGALTVDESAAIQAAMFILTKRLPVRRSRRLRLARRGRQLDLRSTLRASLRTGGDPLHLARRTRYVKPRPLVIICDVSGSMERYARILLQFAYALANSSSGNSRKVEAFVFSTRLTRVTSFLHSHPVRHSGQPDQSGRTRQSQPGQHALDAAVTAAHDWGGGTRIGECLRAFHARWAPRVLGHGAIVLLVSDGCDRGDIPLLRSQLARLQRRSHRLIWLNPWLGQEGYQPSVRGMQAALPYIDRLLPIHNLASLEQLVATLDEIDA